MCPIIESQTNKHLKTLIFYSLFLVHSCDSVFQTKEKMKHTLHHKTCFKRKHVVCCKTHYKSSNTKQRLILYTLQFTWDFSPQ